jgi:hypothetical protein
MMSPSMSGGECGTEGDAAVDRAFSCPAKPLHESDPVQVSADEVGVARDALRD